MRALQPEAKNSASSNLEEKTLSGFSSALPMLSEKSPGSCETSSTVFGAKWLAVEGSGRTKALSAGAVKGSGVERLRVRPAPNEGMVLRREWQRNERPGSTVSDRARRRAEGPPLRIDSEL